ncbi:MAG: alpha/beta hydrolase [Acidimicrobiales bacterium]
MEREEFSVAVPGGHLAGWVAGSGPPVLMLHGGPGLSNYLDSLATEIGDGYRVATYQQRGLEPSTTEGPFEVAQEVADVVAVLGHLGWRKAILLGHSWGGHLVFHVAVSAPDRVSALLAVDPLGSVGDGGLALFEAEMLARTPEADRERAHVLDERALRGEGEPGDALESLRLLWPAYFPDRATAPPMPDIRMSVEAYSGVFASLVASLPTLEAALPAITVPVGVVAGAQSPMPTEESAAATARAVPGAWVEIVEGAGHFPWLDRPGSVRTALDRLAAQVAAS